MKKLTLTILFIFIISAFVSCKSKNMNSNIITNETTLSGKTLDADATVFETPEKVVGTLEDGLPDDGIPRFTTESKKQTDETVESEK